MSVSTPFLDYVVTVTDQVPRIKQHIRDLRALVQTGLVTDPARLNMMEALFPAQMQFASLLCSDARFDPQSLSGMKSQQAMQLAINVVAATGIPKDDTFRQLLVFAAESAYKLWVKATDKPVGKELVTEVICAKPAGIYVDMPFLGIMELAHPAWADRIERVRLIKTKAIDGTEQELADANLMASYERRFLAVRKIVFPDIKSVTPKPANPGKKEFQSVEELMKQAYEKPVDYARIQKKEQIMKEVDREIRKLAPLAEERFVPRQIANTGAPIEAAPRENIVAKLLGTCKERKAQLVAAQESYENVSERARDRYLELLKLRKEIEVLTSTTVKSAMKKDKQDGGGFMCPDSKFDVQIERYLKLASQVESDIIGMDKDIQAAEVELKAAKAASGNATELVIKAEVIAEQTTPNNEETPYDPEPGARRVHFDFDKQDGGASSAGHTVTSMGLAFVTVAMAFVASMAMA